MTRHLVISRPAGEEKPMSGSQVVTADCGHEVWVSPMVKILGEMTSMMGVPAIYCIDCLDKFSEQDLENLMKGD